MKTSIVAIVAGMAALCFAAAAQAEDFPATPMNAGPPRMQMMPMMPMAQPMQPMADNGMSQPMAGQKMSARQKRMMMKKQMQMQGQ